MPWSSKLTQLNDILPELVWNISSIERLVIIAGIRPHMVSFNGSAVDVWNSVLNEAEKSGRVDSLIQAALKEYPNNPYLIAAASDNDINYSLAPSIDEVSNWKGVDADTLEVLTEEVDTMLPISFLEKGVKMSRSVAKVEISRGSKTDVGTGFLSRLRGNEALYFITNYHVINNRSQFKQSRIIFNFELDIDGNSKASASFVIDENGPLYLSPVHEYDIAIFKLLDPDNRLSDYGYLELKTVDVTKNDFVNIIQHPGGQMKQISLYHNIVTHTDHRIIQYLTDTLKGSSGAPVFNSSWDVVAIHHSGGGKRANEPNLPVGYQTRNEGIQINKVVEFLLNQRIDTA